MLAVCASGPGLTTSFPSQTTETSVTEAAGGLKLESKSSTEKDLPLTIKCEDKEEWTKKIESTVKTEREKLTELFDS